MLRVLAGKTKNVRAFGGLPPSVGDADISPSRGEMSRKLLAQKGNE